MRLLLALALLCSSPSLAADLYVGPDGDDAGAGTSSAPLATIARAVEAAGPGDRVLLLPGVYRQSTDIRRSGAPDNPIVIASSSGDPEQFAVIDGGVSPGADLHGEGFRLTDVSWVTIRNIEFVNCWTDVIALTGSSYISVQGCRFVDTGQHAVWTRGSGTHHVLVEHCTWSQDERVWTEWDWTELHHGDLGHYNGGFYGGRDGAGSAVIRHNTIRYAYNGLRWWLKDEEKGRAQANIEIYDNVFEYCLDNSVEPEGYTANLHVYHNVFDSCPNGVFSIDKVDGGPIHVYGNVGRWSRDGGTKEKPWTIYKFSRYGDPGWLDEPLHILHNSWDYMSAFGASGGDYLKAEDHLRHFNNAYRFQGGKDFGFSGWQGRDCLFDHDLSSAPWPGGLTDRGFEENGAVGDPRFADPVGGDYRLQAGSPAVDRGAELPGFTQWYVGEAPDMGAYEGGQLVYGPPFEHWDGAEGAAPVERPRVVRCFARGDQVAVFFSTAMDLDSMPASAFEVTVDGAPVGVREAALPGPRRAVLLTLSQTLEGGQSLGFESWGGPLGANGEAAALWAADLRLVHVPAEATLAGDLADVFGAGVAD